MGKVIAFTNQKGGVGKTTSAVNTAACLSYLGKKVLLCDMDPQGNATSGVGINKKSIKRSIYDALIGAVPAEQAAVRTDYKNLFILPSNINLAGGEVELMSMDDKARATALSSALGEVKDSYDYLIIDCPPSLGLLTINALSASDTFLVPMQCEFFALEGLSQLTMTVRMIKRLYNPTLELEGVLICMYDGRLNLSGQVLAEIKKYYPGKIYKTMIPRNVRLSEAPSYGMPIIYYDKNSRGSECYLTLANEIIDGNM